jgi:nicotinamidase-related amidase
VIDGGGHDVGRIWDDVISEADSRVYAAAGFGRGGGFGERPAVLLIDLYSTDFHLLDDDSFHDPLPSGVSANIEAIRRLLEAARAGAVPIFYSNNLHRADGADIIGWGEKNAAALSQARARAGHIAPFIPEVAPGPDDWIVYKQQPSVFFGTQLVSYLIKLRIDTLIVGGQSTSGCVRATVVDAFSYGFRVKVVEECTFDRISITHKINLFDMHQKYADVISLPEVLAYLRADRSPQPSAGR